MSDQDKSLFSADDQSATLNQTPNQTAAAKQGDTLSESVAILVGEGRKYKTIDDLAKAYLNADEFVEKLKGENATLREELTKAKTLDDVLKRLKDEPSAGTQDRSDQSQGLTAQDVAKIVSNAITGHETAKIRQANLQASDAAMKKLYGDKAAEVFAKAATTPELRKALTELASVSPDKFVAVFQPAQAATGSHVDGSTAVNTAALSSISQSGRVADPGCKEFYDNLRRTKPNEYYSQAVQSQMHKAAIANQEKFFGASS
jgi:hypothetical protein